MRRSNSCGVGTIPYPCSGCCSGPPSRFDGSSVSVTISTRDWRKSRQRRSNRSKLIVLRKRWARKLRRCLRRPMRPPKTVSSVPNGTQTRRCPKHRPMLSTSVRRRRQMPPGRARRLRRHETRSSPKPPAAPRRSPRMAVSEVVTWSMRRRSCESGCCLISLGNDRLDGHRSSSFEPGVTACWRLLRSLNTVSTLR